MRFIKSQRRTAQDGRGQHIHSTLSAPQIQQAIKNTVEPVLNSSGKVRRALENSKAGK